MYCPLHRNSSNSSSFEREWYLARLGSLSHWGCNSNDPHGKRLALDSVPFAMPIRRQFFHVCVFLRLQAWGRDELVAERPAARWQDRLAALHREGVAALLVYGTLVCALQGQHDAAGAGGRGFYEQGEQRQAGAVEPGFRRHWRHLEEVLPGEFWLVGQWTGGVPWVLCM